MQELPNKMSSETFRRRDLGAPQPVPDLPEGLHLVRFTQGDPGEGVHGRKGPANADIVLPEIVDQGANWPLRIEHHEVGRGRDHLQLARRGLTYNSVAVKAVALSGHLWFVIVVERGQTSAQSEDVGAVVKLVRHHQPDGFG